MKVLEELMMDGLFDGPREDGKYYYSGRIITSITAIRSVPNIKGKPPVVSRMSVGFEEKIPNNCWEYELILEGGIVRYLSCDFSPEDEAFWKSQDAEEED